MARWLAIGIMLAVVVPGLAAAQQRTPNVGTKPMLRQYPKAGVWETYLQRRSDMPNAPLECITGTGSFTDPVNYYLWGWGDLNGQFRLFIWDSQVGALSLESIRVVIDDYEVVKAKVTSKEAPAPGVGTGFFAAIPEANALKDVIRNGSSIKFITDKETYSASLDGAAEALSHFDKCIDFAKQLTKLQGNQ